MLGWIQLNAIDWLWLHQHIRCLKFATHITGWTRACEWTAYHAPMQNKNEIVKWIWCWRQQWLIIARSSNKWLDYTIQWRMNTLIWVAQIFFLTGALTLINDSTCFGNRTQTSSRNDRKETLNLFETYSCVWRSR